MRNHMLGVVLSCSMRRRIGSCVLLFDLSCIESVIILFNLIVYWECCHPIRSDRVLGVVLS